MDPIFLTYSNYLKESYIIEYTIQLFSKYWYFGVQIYKIRLHLTSTISYSVMCPLCHALWDPLKWLSVASAIVFLLKRGKFTSWIRTFHMCRERRGWQVGVLPPIDLLWHWNSCCTHFPRWPLRLPLSVTQTTMKKGNLLYLFSY